MISEKEIQLKVTEAIPRDVGRNIARFDPAFFKLLEVEIGDIVKLEGKRTTCARVMPTFPGERNKEIIQIDGITRENVQAGLGEKIKITRADRKAAREIALAPLAPFSMAKIKKDGGYLNKLLDGLACTRGDRIRVNLFGASSQEFIIQEAQPDGFLQVDSSTRVRLATNQAETGCRAGKGNKVFYEDIGGLDSEIKRIREMVELPLRYPEVFERLGIDPPKGLLLTGPPGTGKTLIARAVASETEAGFININGPEIVAKYYGESEARLREIFEKAREKAPTIIFLDEIDAIAPKRSEVAGEVEKRIVAQLLALMDGLNDRNGVIVIGATNLPDSLDPALRRPGRFDRELRIGPPDESGRLKILEIHTRGMPLAGDVDLKYLAGLTHGFVGADLAALCREAAMASLRSVWTDIDFNSHTLPSSFLNSLEVCMDHFRQALREIEPSSLREVFVERPVVRWESIGGMGQIKQILRESIEWPVKYSEVYRAVELAPPKGVLLHGPPGTGKTLLAKAVAAESNANFISIKGPQLFSKWVGETEKGIREVFKKARQAAPCVVFFDELDALAPRRKNTGGDGVADRVVGQLLTEIDGLEELRGVVLLAATNRPDLVDEALLRSGRFDLHLEVPMPDRDARKEILAINLFRKNIVVDPDLDLLSDLTAGYSGADLELICRNAVMSLIRENILAGKPTAGKFTLCEQDIVEAVKEFELLRNKRH
ncbi:MAG: CDC48 family AAA ATPase [Bacillota bacterium]